MELDRYTRITLRLPKDLHAQLEAEAERTSKSLNAEIVARLSASLDPVDDRLLLEGLGHALQEQLAGRGIDMLTMLRKGMQSLPGGEREAKPTGDASQRKKYLEMQLADIDEQVRLSSFPLSDALATLHRAREIGDSEAVAKAQSAYEKERDRVMRLDRRALEIQAELRGLDGAS